MAERLPVPVVAEKLSVAAERPLVEAETLPVAVGTLWVVAETRLEVAVGMLSAAVASKLEVAVSALVVDF